MKKDEEEEEREEEEEKEEKQEEENHIQTHPQAAKPRHICSVVISNTRFDS